MIAFVAGSSLVLVVFLLIESSRERRIHRIELAERLRLRFSDQRHRLIMHAGNGKMMHAELVGFRYLYEATTFALRHSMRYQGISIVACLIAMNPESHSQLPRIRLNNFPTSTTREILREYVDTTNDLVDQFVHPIWLILVFPSGKRVFNWAFDRGRRVHLRQEHEKFLALRDAGCRALGAAA